MNSLFRASALFLVTAGCAATKGDLAALGEETGNQSELDSATPPDDTAITPAPDPAWWSIVATVPVAGTNPVTEGTTVSFTAYPDGADAAPLCTATSPAVSITAEVAPDATIYAWWSTALDISDGACDTEDIEIPTALYLGIGALDPNIVAVLGDAGYAELTSSLYGAYVSLDGGGTVYTFGVAGTASSYEGEPVTDGDPIPDGTWQIEGIYLLPIE